MSITAQEWTVLRAIPRDKVPYLDVIRRRSGLSDSDFESSVRRLVDGTVLMRCSAPVGELLYLTLRGAAILEQRPPA